MGRGSGGGSPWTRALVTGASSGIGEATARRLAAAGTHLVVVARREDRLTALAQELRDRHGVDVEVLVADLATAAGRVPVEARLREGDRSIDLLVNNAGGGITGLFAARRGEVVAAELGVNLEAVVTLTLAALPGMTDRSRGWIVNIASGVGFYPVPGAAVYGASKAFVINFSEAVREELRGTGVHVTAVCPGFTETEGPARGGLDPSRVPRLLRMSADAVAADALAATARGVAVHSPGLLNRTGALLGRHLPHRVMRPLVANYNRRLAQT